MIMLNSIVSYYDIADEIILGLDESFLTWKCNRFQIDDCFYDKLKVIDKDKKIVIVKENFHKHANPMQNETEERNFLSSRCNGKFIIGVDCDEVFLNAKEFDDWLDSQLETFDFDFLCTWKTVYKVFGDNMLVCNPYEPALLGTCHKNSYVKARMTNNQQVQSPLRILHFSWGRTEVEIIQKLNNWGHANEFNVEKHLTLWRAVNLDNYKQVVNFHPLGLKKWWKSLEKIIKTNE